MLTTRPSPPGPITSPSLYTPSTLDGGGCDAIHLVPTYQSHHLIFPAQSVQQLQQTSRLFHRKAWLDPSTVEVFAATATPPAAGGSQDIPGIPPSGGSSGNGSEGPKDGVTPELRPPTISRVESVYRNLDALITPQRLPPPTYPLPKDRDEFRGWIKSCDTICLALTQTISSLAAQYIKSIRSLANAIRTLAWTRPCMSSPLVAKVRKTLVAGRELRSAIATYNDEVDHIRHMNKVAQRFDLRSDFRALTQKFQRIATIESRSRKIDESIAAFVSLTAPHLPSYRMVANAFRRFAKSLENIPTESGIAFELTKVRWDLSHDLLLQAVEGILIGGAIGDAIGAPYEFMDSASIAEVAPFKLAYAPSQRGRLQPGQWTDDTQLALVALDQILTDDVLIPHRLAARMLELYRGKAIRGLGRSVAKALEQLDQGKSWKESGQSHEWSAGGGSAMRIAPIAIRYYNQRDELMRNVEMASWITHRHPIAVEAAKAVAIAIRLALKGQLFPETFIDTMIDELGPESNMSKKLLEYRSLKDEYWKPKDLLALLGTGGEGTDVVATAFAAFLESPEDSEKTIELAVRAGGDTDTRASIAATISGAYNGLWSVPHTWMQGVEGGVSLRERGASLLEKIESA